MKAFYRLFYYISIVLTSILAGVTIAGAFVGNAAPDSFKFMPFIGLMLPILLLANLDSGGAAGRHGWRGDCLGA